LYSLLHLTHLTFTYSESRRLNFFEPQFVQIGHTRVDFTNYISLDQIWMNWFYHYQLFSVVDSGFMKMQM